MEPVESLAGTRPDTFQTRRLDFRFGWNFSTIISLSLSFSFSGSGCWKRRKRRGKLFVSSCGRRGFENWHPLQFAMSSVPIVSCKSNFSFHFCVFFWQNYISARKCRQFDQEIETQWKATLWKIAKLGPCPLQIGRRVAVAKLSGGMRLAIWPPGSLVSPARTPPPPPPPFFLRQWYENDAADTGAPGIRRNVLEQRKQLEQKSRAEHSGTFHAAFPHRK